MNNNELLNKLLGIPKLRAVSSEFIGEEKLHLRVVSTLPVGRKKRNGSMIKSDLTETEYCMQRDEILAVLKSRRRRLKKFGVHSLSLFGSVARNQARQNSDIDILVDFEKPIGIFEFVRLKLYLEEVLGSKVDLVTPEALRKELRDAILREAIRAA